MAISLNYGRDLSGQEDPQAYHDRQKKSFELAKRPHDRFNAEYKSVICKEIQTKLMGRSFDFWKDEDNKAFFAAGGRVDKCPSVVGNGAKWAVGIILEEEEKSGD